MTTNKRRFALNLAEIRVIRRWLETMGQAARLSSTHQGHVTLVASELLVNLLEHAEPAPKSVELYCKVTDGQLTTEITALAHSFSGEEAFHAAVTTPEDVDNLANGGMGMYLIAQFTSEMHYVPAKGRDQPEKFIFTVENA